MKIIRSNVHNRKQFSCPLFVPDALKKVFGKTRLPITKSAATYNMISTTMLLSLSFNSSAICRSAGF